MGGYLDKLLATSQPDELALAMVRVPDYDRRSDRGSPVHVSGYARMGRDAMQAHLTGSHGVGHKAFGKDFAHPQSLGAWHSMDHVARGDGLDHAHPSEDHAAHVAAHLGGEHEHGGAATIVGHAAIYEGPAIAHREIRREADRQTRRRLYRVISKHKGGAKKRPGASGASGASSGASGGSSGGGGGSGGSGGSSGSSGSSSS